MKRITMPLWKALSSGDFDVYIHFADCYGIRGTVAQELPELVAHDANVTGLGDPKKMGHLAYTDRRDPPGGPLKLVAAYVRLTWAGPSSGIHHGALEGALEHVKELFAGQRLLYALPTPHNAGTLALIERCLQGEDHTLLEDPFEMAYAARSDSE